MRRPQIVAALGEKQVAGLCDDGEQRELLPSEALTVRRGWRDRMLMTILRANGL